MNRSLQQALAAVPCAFVLAGCAPLEPGDWIVRIWGEAFIEDSITTAGTDDGWDIAFSTFDVRVTDVSGLGSDGAQLVVTDQPTTFDLVEPTDGQGKLVGAVDATTGVVSDVRWRITPGSDGCGLRVVGTADKGEVNKVFDWCLATEVSYVNCGSSSMVEPALDGNTELTIHGDHLFFDDLVSETPNVAFDLLAAADDSGNADGYVDPSEMEATDITGEDRYQVGSADVEDLWSFVEAQARLVGHIDGEGHCDTE